MTMNANASPDAGGAAPGAGLGLVTELPLPHVNPVHDMQIVEFLNFDIDTFII